MITARSDKERYKTIISDGTHEIYGDVGKESNGNDAGLNPHEILEAAYASCINMTVRIWAEKFNVPLTKVQTKVSIDRSREGKTVFRYKVETEGDLSDENRERLQRLPLKSPIMHTLSREIVFEAGDDL